MIIVIETNTILLNFVANIFPTSSTLLDRRNHFVIDTGYLHPFIYFFHPFI